MTPAALIIKNACRTATGSGALGLQLQAVLAVPNAPASIHCGDNEDHFLVLQVSYDLSNAALQHLSERKSLSYEEPPWCLFAERDVKRMMRMEKLLQDLLKSAPCPMRPIENKERIEM